MERFCTSWRYFFSALVFCLLLCPLAHGKPMGPNEYLQSLEPAPSSLDLYTFFAIYDDQFAQCQHLEAYLKALSYLADNGEKNTVRQRLANMSHCLPQAPQIVLWANTLTERVTVSSRAVAESKPPQSAPVNEVQNSTSSPQDSTAVVASRSDTPGNLTLNKAAQTKKPKIEKLNTPTPASVLPNAIASRPLQHVSREPLAQSAAPKPSPLSMSVKTQQYYKDGDKGTSRLFKTENKLAIQSEKKWQASLSTIYLTSFDATKKTDTGSSYLTEKRERLVTERTVFVPEFSYEWSNFTVAVGTSPLGGVVSPLPTGKVTYTDKQFTATAYHQSVSDSLLSYVGFTDVYTGEKMGRVMKAGGKAAWLDTFASDWFYGASTTGAYLYGKNVKENSEVKADAFIGKSFGQVAAGVYLQADHYEHNLNNFTYGHGGYYSPQLAASAAGFVSWEHKGEDIYCKIDTSLGHLYEEIDSSPKYYFRSDAKGENKGEYNNNFVSNSGIEVVVPLGTGVEMAFSSRLLTSAKYYEGTGGASLKIDF